MNKIQELLIQLQANEEELVASNEEIEASLEELSSTHEELSLTHEELRESLDRSRAIINAIPDILFILNKEGIFLDCHVNRESKISLPKEAFLGKNIYDTSPKNVADLVYENVKLVLESNELKTVEYELEINGDKNYFESRIIKSSEDEVIIIERNLTKKKEMEKDLDYLSYNDQLTGVYNRRFFEEELERIDLKENLPITVLFADVNGLKLVNDSFGHRVGDELLTRVAKVLKKSCRNRDIISRIGGDEFVILLPNTNSLQAEKVINRIKKMTLREKVEAIDLSVSFGLGIKENEDEDIMEALKKAEDNMYKNKLFEGPSMRNKTIQTIIKTLNEKNDREEQHSKRVSILCKDMGRILNLPDEEILELETLGLLHDIGKIAISDSILDKDGKLTEEEQTEIRKHPEIGYRILSTVSDLADMATYVLSHHERWDGKGYPRGLKGEEISFKSRIIAIADAYDAMVSKRPYRNPLSKEEAISEIKKNAGIQFDPTLSRIFIETVLKEKW